MAAQNKTCPYCHQPAKLAYMGDDGYPYRADYGPVWGCKPCQAHVGCHPGTTNPLGSLASPQLRKARMAAHHAFDPIWKADVAKGNTKGWSRRKAYRWLAGEMGMKPNHCHISWMDEDQCARVVELCTNHEETPA